MNRLNAWWRRQRERLADCIAPERIPVERMSMRLWPDGEVVIDSGKGPVYRRWVVRLERTHVTSYELTHQ